MSAFRAGRRTACLVPFLLLLSSSAPGQRQTVLRVPQAFTSIQRAVDAARIGDTVLVDHGLYHENLRINRNIVLASRFVLDGDTAHISQTVLDGSRPSDKRKASTVCIFGPTDSTCTVIGFTIQGGSGTYVIVREDLISHHWIEGGGVAVVHAGARIAHNVVTQNVLSAQPWSGFTAGAGIAASDTSDGTSPPPPVIIERNVVTNNLSAGEWGEAGGIGLYQPGELRHNYVTDNRASSRRQSPGGGIILGLTGNYDVVADGNYICRNAAGVGGGLLVTSAFVRRGRAIVENNIIAHNEASELGGGVHLAERCYAVFVNNTIVHNSALSSGSGMNVAPLAHASLANNILWHNEKDQVAVWSYVQASHNLVQGGINGTCNIDEDPAFLPGDSLFRLSPNSPCLGTGLPALTLAGRPLPVPREDFGNAARPLPVRTSPDIGAIESPFEPAASGRILRQQAEDLETSLKLTVIFRQTSPPEHGPANDRLIRAGRMAVTVIANDTSRQWFGETFPGLSFSLPPGPNYLEVEILGLGRDTTRALGLMYELEGFESLASFHSRQMGYAYRHYDGLKPGSYRLMLQPSDDEGTIGHINRIYIDIVVQPHWYQRWWAYLIYATAVLLIASAIYRVRARRLRLELETSRLSELDRMKSRFLANVSHEFRTPLSLILGPVDQLERSEPLPDRKEQLGVVKRNAERLLHMVNQLLQYSRVEAGTLKLHVQLQPVPQILRRVVSSFSTAAVKKGIGLHIDVEPSHFEGYVDAEKLEHVLENLVSNAVKHTPAGGRVDVRAQRSGTDLVLEVSDSGHGISPEDLPHVFERFFRVDPSHQYEGAGIGLSLTKELVEIHHGAISLSSTVGVGTVATVHLPLSGYQTYEIVEEPLPEPADGPAIAERVPGPATPPEAAHGESTVVLVAEDNEDARKFIRSRLSPEFNVVEAVHGAQAWDYAVHRVPDVIITDVMMPEMSGYELCAKLKQDERTSHIPIILLTALADQTDKIEGLQTGADDYLTKPFDARELLVRVRNLIATRKRLQERFRTSFALKPGEVQVQSLDNGFLQKVMAIVEAHMSEEQFGVEQLAYEAHLSRAQLHRKLKALTNLTPTEFVRHFRLLRARDLLEKRAGSVSEVAYRVGFSNQSYFAKCFKEQFGYLPSEIGQSNGL
jgi:signal transduction histidine kinase/DNA-binding response OmpR family regulator